MEDKFRMITGRRYPSFTVRKNGRITLKARWAFLMVKLFGHYCIGKFQPAGFSAPTKFFLARCKTHGYYLDNAHGFEGEAYTCCPECLRGEQEFYTAAGRRIGKDTLNYYKLGSGLQSDRCPVCERLCAAMYRSVNKREYHLYDANLKRHCAAVHPRDAEQDW